VTLIVQNVDSVLIDDGEVRRYGKVLWRRYQNVRQSADVVVVVSMTQIDDVWPGLAAGTRFFSGLERVKC
jgi:hypothetical protein